MALANSDVSNVSQQRGPPRALCATLPVPLSTVDVAKAFRKFGRAHGNNQLGQRRNANEET